MDLLQICIYLIYFQVAFAIIVYSIRFGEFIYNKFYKKKEELDNKNNKNNSSSNKVMKKNYQKNNSFDDMNYKDKVDKRKYH